jgi:hypothetical protein
VFIDKIDENIQFYLALSCRSFSLSSLSPNPAHPTAESIFAQLKTQNTRMLAIFLVRGLECKRMG